MNAPSPTAVRQSGLSLIELMVAILIGLFLIAGTISIFISNKQSYNTQDDLSRIQETGRFAMDMILRDVRMAGYFGCVHDMSQVKNVLYADGVPGSLLNTRSALEGLDESNGKWLPSNVAPNIGPETETYGGTNAGDLVAGTDGITIRYASGQTWPLNADMSSQAQDVPVNYNPTSPTPPPANGTQAISAASLAQNEIAVVSNCGEAYVFEITNTPTSAAPALQHVTAGNSYYQNQSPDLGFFLQSQLPLVAPLVAHRYFICNAAATPPNAGFVPALCQVSYDPNSQNVTPQPLLPGVEDMQITYGYDSTNSGGPVNAYVSANNVADWTRVLAVKVGLLVRSVNESATNPLDTNTYNVNGTPFTPNPPDRRKRRLFESVVYLRNAGAF